VASERSFAVTVTQRGEVSHDGSHADHTVVWLRGKHDASTQAALSESMARVIALDDADLIIDLSGVESMSSATVGVIKRAVEFLRPRSRSVSLQCPSPAALRVVEVSGLAELVDAASTDATLKTGAADALSTWVRVPVAERSDSCVEPSPASPIAPRVWLQIESVRRGGLRRPTQSIGGTRGHGDL
jgi:anti-anti-sigma factor